MPYRKLILLFVILLLTSNYSYSQTFDNAFFAKNLAMTSYAIDTEASAVILFDKTEISYGMEPYGAHQRRYIQTESVHRIVKILKADALNGEDNLVNIHIHYYPGNGENYVYKLKGKTYNLEAGKVIETGIGKTDVYDKDVTKKHDELSFSFAGVKPGSIVEYSYDLVTDAYGGANWNVQGRYPKLISEYSIIYPKVVEFATLMHVGQPLKKCASPDDAIKDSSAFCSSLLVEDPNNTSFWVRKNVPAIKYEAYVNTLVNYTDHVNFLFTGATAYNFKETPTWDKFNDDILSWYTKMFNGDYENIDAACDSILRADRNVDGRKRDIFNYVRSNFSVHADDDNASDKMLNRIFKNKKGSRGDINWMLLYMYFHAGINAYPLFLSTTGSMSPSAAYPTPIRLNYMVCAVKMDSGYMYLDPSGKSNYYGALPAYCYNGYARIIDSAGESVNLTTDMIKDKTVVGITISAITDSGAKVEIVRRAGMVTSAWLRRRWAEDDTAKHAYVNDFIQALPADFEITDNSIANVENADTSLVEKYSGTLSFKRGADHIYVASNLVKDFEKNPFIATVRNYPVDFPFKSEYQCFTNITLPADMEPADLPTSNILDFENSSMTHKKLYNYTPALHMLTVSSSFSINATNYPTTDYSSMRDYFLQVIQSDNEIINLKKKSAK